MKKFFLILTLILSNLYALAEPNPVIVHNGGSVDDRSQNLTQTDMPRVYYDNDTHEIIIDGGGEVSYYEVEITSAINGYYELYTVVNGTYDTFDVSLLSAGSHVITITSPLGNIYEGTFTVY